MAAKNKRESAARCPEKAYRATPLNYIPNYSMNGISRGVMHPSPGFMNPRFPMAIQIVPGTRDRSKIPDLPPAIIEGVVRERGRFLIAGPSKSWKSFLAIGLGLAVASGGKWLGFSCKPGKVLYVNIEIDDSQFRTRVATMADNLDIGNDLLEENFSIMLRQKEPFDAADLAESLIDRFKDDSLNLVLIDPVYFLLDGSENESEVARKLCEQIDRISLYLGCAVGVVHHHSKGQQYQKDVTDRSCGSSVLGRYFDAIIDVDRLQAPGNAMRAEFALRDYPEKRPVEYRFIYPLCVPDETGELASCGYAVSRANTSRSEDKRAADLARIEAECEKRLQGRESFERRELVDALHMGSQKISRLLKSSTKFKAESGSNSCPVSRR